MDALDRELINALHGGFPIEDRPYAQVAALLGTTEDEVIRRLERLLADGVLTRFGPLYDAVRLGGALTLAAMEVPEDRFDEIATLLETVREVAHNYRREHRLNMWFVVGTDDAARIDATLRRIEAETGLTVLNFPKEREYFLELRLPA